MTCGVWAQADTTDHARVGNPASRAERVAHYRDYAGQIRDLASGEPDQRLRQRLLVIAQQYEDLATRLEAKPERR